MAAHAIEIILTRQWAEAVSVPVMLTDTAGKAIFYNTSAEELIGRNYSDHGSIPMEEWKEILTPLDHQGNVDPAVDLPLLSTVSSHEPRHAVFCIKSDSKLKMIEMSSFGIVGVSGQMLGAVAVFWTKSQA